MYDLDLAHAIYQKYYQEAKARGIVWTTYDYAVDKGLYVGDDEDFDEDAIPELKEHGQAIKDVMALEISFFVFRHLNGPWGEVIDTLMPLRHRYIHQYREKTGFEIETGNLEKLY